MNTHTHFVVRKRGKFYVVKDRRNGLTVGTQHERRLDAINEMNAAYAKYLETLV